MKLITCVSKGDDDSVFQLGPRIFTLQCVSSQLPRLHCLAEPPFQVQMQHPEQLEDWPDRESIPPSSGTPALRSRHRASPGAAYIHPQPERCQSGQGGEHPSGQRDRQACLPCWDVPGTRSLSRVPVLTHLPPFHQPGTSQPFGWLSAPQPGPALGAEAHPAQPEQQPRGREGHEAAALTYPAVRPPYVL